MRKALLLLSLAGLAALLPQAGLWAASSPASCSVNFTVQSISLTDWDTGPGIGVLPSQWTVGTYDLAQPAAFDTPDWAAVGGLPDGRTEKAAFVANLDVGDCPGDDQSGVLTLTSPTIDIPAETDTLKIALNHWFDIEYGWDGGNLKISVNEGPFMLVPGSDFPGSAFETGPYTDELLEAIRDFSPYNLNPLAEQEAFTGPGLDLEGGSWGVSRVKLAGSFAAGDSIQLRFDFGIDECFGTDEGWYIDEVEVYSCTPSPPGLTIVKQVVNDDGGTATVDDFSITTNAGTLVFDAGSTVGDTTTYTSAQLTGLTAGDYTLVEADVAGYAAGSWSCIPDVGGGAFDSGSVTLPPDEAVTCTITNDDIVPAITVTKTGPDTAKVGDTITYTIGFSNTNTHDLENCTGTDTLLGSLGTFTAGVNQTFDYTVLSTDPDPLPNTATITCDVVGFDNQASDSADHSVNLIDPAITVTKTGPAIAQVGDTITYTIGFSNTGIGDVENCTGNDTVIGPLGAFTAGVNRTFDYTVQAGDPNPLSNTATITCDVVGLDNQVSDSAGHSVNLIDPAITVTKTGPDTAKVGDTITYTIGFSNTGIGDVENCTGDDTVIGPLGAFTAGVNRTFDYTVQAGDPNPLLNTATITCDVVGFGSQASDSAGHSLNLIDPAITVTKTGPATAQIGDTITYTIGFSNTGIGDVENCTGSDSLFGSLGAFEDGVNQTFDYTVQAGDPNPLLNTATITCDVVGFDNQASDDDSHSVNLVDPAITVTKTGPAIAKVGDTITYTVGFSNTGIGTLENCTGTDTLLGSLGAFEAGVNRTFDYTVQAGDPNPLLNTATITCDVVETGNQASSADSHSVNLVDPAITVSKTGAATAKVGDTIIYTIGFSNTGIGDVENCIGNDTLIGLLGAFEAGVTRDFDYTVQAGDPNPLLNTATITCDVVGFDNQASDSADHSVDLIDPAIAVSKTGPAVAKVGDTITYTIGFSNTGTGTLGTCTGSDTVIGPLGAFEDGVTRDFDYTVQAGDPNPLLNTATITCDVAGVDNQASDSADHSVDLIDPAITVTKTGPAVAEVGDTITYTIGFSNTGTGTLGTCTGSDTVIGPLGTFTAGLNRTFDYTVQAGDPNPLSNTATITCDVAGVDNQASDSADHSVDLIDPAITVTKTGPAVAEVGDTITYTIGFSNTGTGDVENCTGDDTVIGALGAFEADVTRDFDYTVQAGDPNPLLNTATITCDVVGADNQASDSADHSVDLIDPAITVTKTGPANAQVGDTITYTIGFSNTGTGEVENCTGDDTVIGPLGAFEDGVTRDFDYTVQAGDPNPLLNTATITCDVVGVDNQASDSADHSVNLGEVIFADGFEP